MSSSRKTLAEVKNYSIDLVTKNANTFSIQITYIENQAIIADLPLDPMDNTLAAVIDKSLKLKLGEDIAPVLEALSKTLEQIGAKELIVLPTGIELPDYLPVQKAEKRERLRHISRNDLEKNTKEILNLYPKLVSQLDQDYKFVVSMPAITKMIPSHKLYKQVYNLLKTHAHFTKSKHEEYTLEFQSSNSARFNNSTVLPVALLDPQNKLCGFARILSMGNKFAYVSDETINQEIIPLSKFRGETTTDQTDNRSIFLLAYLAHKAVAAIKNQDHLLIIAAAGRENIYDRLGMEKFPIKSDDYVVTMKFTPPGQLLTSIKQELTKTFSNSDAINKFGINANQGAHQTITEINEINEINEIKKSSLI